MNNGGIARKLVNCASLIAGRLPGSLAQTNIVANMLFGAVSGSGSAAAAAIGGIMGPMEEEQGYDKSYYAAVNIASAPTGMMIPPSNTLIVYATVAGTVSISALFMAGYIPGILWGVGNMIVAGVMAKKLGIYQLRTDEHKGRNPCASGCHSLSDDDCSSNRRHPDTSRLPPQKDPELRLHTP